MRNCTRDVPLALSVAERRLAFRNGRSRQIAPARRAPLERSVTSAVSGLLPADFCGVLVVGVLLPDHAAHLFSRLLENIEGISQPLEFPGRPRLGINVGAENGDDRVQEAVPARP